MINIEDLKVSLMLHPRFNHSIGVMKMALKLNAMHHLGIDEDYHKALLLQLLARMKEVTQFVR